MTSVSLRVRNAWPSAVQLGDQLLVVVDLAVEDDDRRCRPRCTAAAGRSQVDDRQAPMAEPDAGLDVQAALVGTAVVLRLVHALQQRRGRSRACRGCRRCRRCRTWFTLPAWQRRFGRARAPPTQRARRALRTAATIASRLNAARARRARRAAHAAAPVRVARSASRRSRKRAARRPAARAARSRRLTSSALPPTRVAITGKPLAIASRIVFEMPSASEAARSSRARAARPARRRARRAARPGPAQRPPHGIRANLRPQGRRRR